MKMKQIQIGTCIPGTQAEKWIPYMVDAGFECVAINFHMSLEGVDLGGAGQKGQVHAGRHWRAGSHAGILLQRH